MYLLIQYINISKKVELFAIESFLSNKRPALILAQISPPLLSFTSSERVNSAVL